MNYIIKEVYTVFLTVPDLGIDWLEKSFEEHDPNLPYATIPIFESLHSHPRFKDLLRKMNLPVDVKK